MTRILRYMTGSPARRLARPDPHHVETVKDLGAALKRLIAISGMSLGKLAGETHFSTSTLHNATTGRHLPGVGVVEALTRSCGADADEIEGWRDARLRAHVNRRLASRDAPVGDDERQARLGRKAKQIARMRADKAVSQLEQLSVHDAAEILAALPADFAEEVLSTGNDQHVADWLREMDPADAGQLLSSVDAKVVAAPLELMAPELGGVLLEYTGPRSAPRIFWSMRPKAAAAILQSIRPSQLYSLTGDVSSEQWSTILPWFSDQASIDVLAGLPEAMQDRILLGADRAWAGRMMSLRPASEVDAMIGRLSAEEAVTLFNRLPTQDAKELLPLLPVDTVAPILVSLRYSRICKLLMAGVNPVAWNGDWISEFGKDAPTDWRGRMFAMLSPEVQSAFNDDESLLHQSWFYNNYPPRARALLEDKLNKYSDMSE